MNESTLLACGALRAQCSELLMGYCSGCGGRYTSDETKDGHCPICNVEFAGFSCGRCNGEFSARPVSIDHACQSVSVYRVNGNIAFEKEGRLAREALRRAEEGEKARLRKVAELEDRLKQSEAHGRKLEVAKAKAVEAAMRRATEAESLLKKTEATLRESKRHVPDTHRPDTKARTKFKIRYFLSFFIIIACLYFVGKHNEEKGKKSINADVVSSQKPLPEKSLKSEEIIASSKYPRCAGSYEQKKCEDFERSLAAESLEVKIDRARKLDESRQLVAEEIVKEPENLDKSEGLLSKPLSENDSSQDAPTNGSKIKFPRCAGSYEPKKCEEFESQLLNETPEDKQNRISRLEGARKNSMRSVNQNSDTRQVTEIYDLSVDKNLINKTPSAWLRFLSDGGRNFISFDHLSIYRCAIKTVRWGLGRVPNTPLLLPADCDTRRHYASSSQLGAYRIPFNPIDQGENEISVEITFFDGTVSNIGRFQIPQRMSKNVKR